ncbi:MAG: serine hydrolase [Flavobacteriaceae bacterium]
MLFFHPPKSVVAIIFCASMAWTSYGHNGAIAYAYPMESVTVDADLSDWPAGLEKYPISYYQFGFKPESTDDIRGYFIIGYNQELQEVYIGVEMVDDTYIRNKENPEYWAHDMQVLYIDPQHKAESTGVFALEVNEYFRKIVDHEVNWDPFVLNASWEMVSVKAQNTANSTIYEWKIKLENYISEGRTLGFDYVVFDKDSKNGNSNTIGWGSDEGVKHECSKCLGDIVLMPPNDSYSLVEGTVETDINKIFPRTVRLKSEENPSAFVNTVVDSTGVYRTKIRPGKYLVEVPAAMVEVDEEIYRLAGNNTIRVNSMPNQPSEASGALKVSVIPRPDLIPEKGLLHDFNSEKEAKLNQIIEAYSRYYGIAGISFALIKDGQLFYHKTYGYKNNSNKALVDHETLFEAASITKPVFAYVVLKLVEKGVIEMDKPLAEYLPFEDLEEYPEYKKMTARHVLIHKTGLPNWGRQMESSPGEKYGYSGEGFEYLKRVVMHITNKEADKIIDEELKTPGNISHMQFRDNPGLRKVAASGHINESPTVRFLPQKPGMAWSMYTEASEFSKFALTLLHRKGLNEASFDEMMEFHSDYPEDEQRSEVHREGMGLGIALRDSDYGKVFGHGGNNGDFKCMFEVYKDLGMGYIMFTNSDTGDQLTDDLAQILIEGKTRTEVSGSKE